MPTASSKKTLNGAYYDRESNISYLNLNDTYVTEILKTGFNYLMKL